MKLKSRIAFGLGLVSLIISFITLYSVFSKAEEIRDATIMLRDMSVPGLSQADVESGNIPEQLTAVTVMVSAVNQPDPSTICFETGVFAFEKHKGLSKVHIRFSNPYEAQAALEVLKERTVDIVVPYYQTINSRWGNRTDSVSFKGEYVYTNSDVAIAQIDGAGDRLSLTSLSDKRLRKDEIEKGIYRGPYSKIDYYWDAFKKRWIESTRSEEKYIK
jgi:hypothetical protein